MLHPHMRKLVAYCILLTPGIVIADAVIHLPTRIAFPDEIAGFTRGREVDYESKNPGTGFSYGYNRKPNMVATVYVYSGGQCPVAPGTGGAVAKMREQTIGEIRQVWSKQGMSVQALLNEVVQFKGEKGDVGVLFDLFEVRETAQATMLWLWAARGHFIKVRLTNVAPRQGDDEMARAFVAELVRLADATPPKPETPKTTIHLDGSLNKSGDPEQIVWLTYGYSLVHWTMQCVLLNPASRSFQIPYVATHYARANQIKVWRSIRNKYAEKVTYMEEMARIEDAGFFDDYLWRYVPDPAWGPPPASISARRAEFDRWMAENLPAHQPQTKAFISISTR